MEIRRSLAFQVQSHHLCLELLRVLACRGVGLCDYDGVTGVLNQVVRPRSHFRHEAAKIIGVFACYFEVSLYGLPSNTGQTLLSIPLAFLSSLV